MFFKGLMKFLFILIYLSSSPLWAKFNVVTTSPELAWLSEKLLNQIPNTKVESLLQGNEDAHHVEALPSFVHKLNRAQIVVAVGLEFEDAWLNKAITLSANSQIQRPQGLCHIGDKITVLEKPTMPIDRSQGDVHAGGNPHFLISPQAMIEATRKLGDCFIENGQAVEVIEKNIVSTQLELQQIYQKIKTKLSNLKNKKMIQYHREFSYFFRDFEIQSSRSLEDIPGVSPSARSIATTALWAKSQKVYALLASTHNPKSSLEKFQELSQIKYLVVQSSMTLPLQNNSYEEWLNKIADQLLSL